MVHCIENNVIYLFTVSAENFLLIKQHFHVNTVSKVYNQIL